MKKILLLFGLLCASVFSVFASHQTRPYKPDAPWGQNVLTDYAKLNLIPINAKYVVKDGKIGVHCPKFSMGGIGFVCKLADFVDLADFDQRDLKFAKLYVSAKVHSKSLGNWHGRVKGADTTIFEFGETTTCLSGVPVTDSLKFVFQTGLMGDTLWISNFSLRVEVGDTVAVNVKHIRANIPEWGYVSDSSVSGCQYKGEEFCVEATPVGSNYFIRWSQKVSVLNDDFKINPYIVTDFDTITAIFVSENTIPRITVLPKVDSMGSVKGSGSYLVGDSIKLKATAYPSHRFVRWQSASGADPYVVSVTDTIWAIFEKDPDYDPKTDSFYVEVSGCDLGYDAIEGSDYYHYGDTLRIRYDYNYWNRADRRYTVHKWYSLDNGYDEIPYKDLLIATKPTSVCGNILDADYVFKGTVDVIVVPNNPEFGTVSGGGSLHAGDSLNLKAEPKPGYIFVGWNSRQEFSLDTVAGYDVVTGIFIPDPNADGVEALPNDGNYAADALVNVYSIEGCLLKAKVPYAQSLVGLKKGVYVVGRKKVVLAE